MFRVVEITGPGIVGEVIMMTGSLDRALKKVGAKPELGIIQHGRFLPIRNASWRRERGLA